MEFFKRDMKEGNKEDTKLVGAEVPTNIFYYFNLFCVVDKRSKSSIIRPLIEEWAKEAMKDFPEKQLIKLASKMGYENWVSRKKRKQPFIMVIKQQERELRKKGISEDMILKILKKIEGIKNKNASELKIERIIKKNKRIKQHNENKKNKEGS